MLMPSIFELQTLRLEHDLEQMDRIWWDRLTQFDNQVLPKLFGASGDMYIEWELDTGLVSFWLHSFNMHPALEDAMIDGTLTVHDITQDLAVPDGRTEIVDNLKNVGFDLRVYPQMTGRALSVGSFAMTTGAGQVSAWTVKIPDVESTMRAARLCDILRSTVHDAPPVTLGAGSLGAHVEQHASKLAALEWDLDDLFNK